MTNFDYDNDWVATNNWDNLHRTPLRAYMYYSVTETKTHWFVMYSSFHPRDYAACIPTGKANAVGEHENERTTGFKRFERRIHPGDQYLLSEV